MTAEPPPSPDVRRLVIRHALHDAWARTFPRGARVLLLGGEPADEEWLRLCGCAPVTPAPGPGLADGACNGLSWPDSASRADGLGAALTAGAPVVLALPRGTAAGDLPAGFTWRTSRGLGLLLPASRSWPARHPLWFGILAALDQLCGRWPILRDRAPWQLRVGIRG